MSTRSCFVLLVTVVLARSAITLPSGTYNLLQHGIDLSMRSDIERLLFYPSISCYRYHRSGFNGRQATGTMPELSRLAVLREHWFSCWRQPRWYYPAVPTESAAREDKVIAGRRGWSSRLSRSATGSRQFLRLHQLCSRCPRRSNRTSCLHHLHQWRHCRDLY